MSDFFSLTLHRLSSIPNASRCVVEPSKLVQRFAAMCGLVILISLAVRACLSDGVLLDWDTYQRIQFIVRYDPSGVDTHVLYHVLLLGLVDLGLSPVDGVFALTSVSAGLLAVAAWSVAKHRGLRGRALPGRAPALGL